MRLFISINLTNHIKDAIMDVQDDLMFKGVEGRYTPPQNMHLTLAFIGEYNHPDEVLDVIKTIDFEPFTISLDGMGSFGRLWWIGIKEKDILNSLASSLRRGLADNDIPFDRKKFSPHITILRNTDRALDEAALASAGMVKNTSMTVDHISLMRSDRGKNGMKYTEL